MGLFDFLKKAEPKVAFTLPVPYQPLPQKLSGKKLLQLWQDADRTQGQPVLLVLDGTLEETIRENASCPVEEADLNAFLQQRKAEYESFDPIDPHDIMGNPDDKYVIDDDCFESFGLNDGSSIVLAQVPVQQPWEIFRLLPIGGWNECPDSGVLMAFCHRVYERFGAVPARISGDTLELIPSRKPSLEEARELARQMYLVCPDIVEQGYETIYALANHLTTAQVWFFWWD